MCNRSSNLSNDANFMLRFEQDFLEEAPMSWDSLVKKTFRKKEEILPMQMAEVRMLYALQFRHKLFAIRSAKDGGTTMAEIPPQARTRVVAPYYHDTSKTCLG